MSAPNHQHHPAIKLPLSLSIIFGSFTLGFYVAIQGPTLMDLIDLLHVNNDIMAHSLAFASLAYSFGGLLSGFLFNYIDRQVLIPGYYVVFGVSNILTPYITNYYIFSVVTVFKMMCAGGTDCGANVWILDMWPGKDAWLQALHFSFAVGCALGPLVVEPFLSASEHSGNGDASLHWDGKGSALINNENTESRIYIPYGVSGGASLLAAAMIVFLYYAEGRKRRQERLACAPVTPVATIMPAGGQSVAVAIPGAAPTTPPPPQQHQQRLSVTLAPTLEAGSSGMPLVGGGAAANKSQPALFPIERPSSRLSSSSNVNQTNLDKLDIGSNLIATPPDPSSVSQAQAQLQLQQLSAASPQQRLQTTTTPTTTCSLQPAAAGAGQAASSSVKFTSKAREQLSGRPPYYVMFAIALAALCLSFYCGIEITSMNYLATFAVNIDLQLPKSTAALMSSALTISFAVGRLFGIWIAAYMRPHKLFYLCSAVMALGNVFILIFANTAERLLWASICVFGIGCGPMYASIVSFYDDKIAKVTNTVSGIFILGSMFNVALNTLIIGHYIIDNALILIVCNLIGAVLLLCLFGSLHALTRIKKNQRKRKFKLQQLRLDTMKTQQQAALEAPSEADEAALEQQVALLDKSVAAASAGQSEATTQQSHNHHQTPTSPGGGSSSSVSNSNSNSNSDSNSNSNSSPPGQKGGTSAGQDPTPPPSPPATPQQTRSPEKQASGEQELQQVSVSITQQQPPPPPPLEIAQRS